jgi:hypothetical protein
MNVGLSRDLARPEQRAQRAAGPADPSIGLAPRPGVQCQRTVEETAMAKGQMKGNKEAKKPKGDKPKSGGSPYKLSQGAPGGPATNPFGKKK